MQIIRYIQWTTGNIKYQDWYSVTMSYEVFSKMILKSSKRLSNSGKLLQQKTKQRTQPLLTFKQTDHAQLLPWSSELVLENKTGLI